MAEVERNGPGAPEDGEQPVDAAQAAVAAIAEQVRSDSVNLARPTRMGALSSVVPEPGRLEALVASVTTAGTYPDIKLLVAAEGVRYLYSERAITRSQVERFAVQDEVRRRIAARVREDSGGLAQLTPVNALGVLIPGAEIDKIDGHLALLLDDSMYRDMRLIANSKGTRFLYSETSMTRTYAEILARAEAKDACGTMAITIRDDSRLYPRPTRLDVFGSSVFGIDPDDLDRLASEMTGRPEYQDIKLVKASNGAVYLYSDQYLNPDWVKATVEWEEVGRYLNP